MTSTLFAQSQDNVQELIRLGLQAEALRDYSGAIESYGKALRAAPDNTISRARVIAVFKSLTEQGAPTDHLGSLVPEEVFEELRQLGYVQSTQDQKDALLRANILFWITLVLVLILIVVAVVYIFKKLRLKAADSLLPTNRPRSSSKQSSIDRSHEAFSKRESVITDRTRQEITSVISGVKSITGAQPRPENLDPPPNFEDLENSGVVNALAQTMVSEVASEQTEQGKFSKMTLEASLIFDESDLPPDLEEYRKKNGDEVVQDYLNRMNSKNRPQE